MFQPGTRTHSHYAELGAVARPGRNGPTWFSHNKRCFRCALVPLSPAYPATDSFNHGGVDWLGVYLRLPGHPALPVLADRVYDYYPAHMALYAVLHELDLHHELHHDVCPRPGSHFYRVTD